MNNENIYVIGDIHGQFDLLCMFLVNKVKNIIVIVAGDCGFGFNLPVYYSLLFNKYNQLLINNNIKIYFVRGNHDNPEYFNSDKYPKLKYEFESFKIIPDYSVINDHILVIGGAVSIDRIFRRRNINWWEGEEIMKLDKLPDHVCSKNIDTIISHECPSICNPILHKVDYHVSNTIKNKIHADREYLTKIFKNIKPKYWFYGHYHKYKIENIDGCIFTCCEMFDLFSKNNDKILHKIA